jgi:hypothetical protein
MTYRACPTKRSRRTKAEIEHLKSVIYDTVKTDAPMTVRQVFYQLVHRGEIGKSENEYQQVVVRLLTQMRVAGDLPFHWIVDQNRRRRVTRTYDNIAQAAEDTARFYRRSALQQAPVYIEVWIEKEALAGVLWDVTSDYDIPLLPSKGMPSITFLHDTASKVDDEWHLNGRHSFIYLLYDHDPTGSLIPRTIQDRLTEFSQTGTFTVEQLALTPDQIDRHNLPYRPTKRTGNRHAKGFEGESVELDALRPSVLKDIVRRAIAKHIPDHQLHTLRAAEQSEREALRAWAQAVEGGAA